MHVWNCQLASGHIVIQVFPLSLSGNVQLFIYEQVAFGVVKGDKFAATTSLETYER